MPGTGYRRLVLILLATFALTILGVTLFRVLGSGWLTNGSAISTPLGWTIPLMTAFVVLAAGWLLLSQCQESDTPESFDTSTIPCPGCGRPVLRDWRLCPYCTTTFEDEAIRGDTHPRD